MTIILSSEERQRFAAWCEQDASADEELMDQLSKLDNNSTAKTLIRAKYDEALAKRVVAEILLQIEDVQL